MKKLRWLNQNLSISIPVFLVLGLAAGLLFPVQGLSVLIAPLTLLMVYPMMVGLKPKQLLESGKVSMQYRAKMNKIMLIPLFAIDLSK